MTATLIALAAVFMAAPTSARAQSWLPCDTTSVEYFSKFWHIKKATGLATNDELNARAVNCNNAYDISPSFRLTTGYFAIAMVNSYSAQSFALGVSFEAQYRPAALGGLGAYAGLDAGFMYGYQGFLNPNALIGPFRAVALLKGGVLYDIPGTNMTVFAGVRYAPPRSNGSGVIAPAAGLKFDLGPPRATRVPTRRQTAVTRDYLRPPSMPAAQRF
ncbi:hypothetical protein [Maritimibacter sp. UBA3975]|uniref:hypothetical protein n=1 Tax=Maritimibacter sp. UBA3975 TaxID=1946833 RepID=UPI000C093DA9|nr:hypothetical protein [Maritimibacter sp. UBA3975]MAM60882.1 hypothetical protein [Maritimibacter sp.]|tara:strand:- start:28584 stop:29231 length:648 start_codon:yes stop_codon:yes gene_type:complete